MPDGYRLVSYADAQRTARAGVLVNGRVTSAEDILGPRGASVIDILRKWDEAHPRLAQADAHRLVGAHRHRQHADVDLGHPHRDRVVEGQHDRSADRRAVPARFDLDTVQHDCDSSGNNKIDSTLLERAEDLDQMTFLGTLGRSHTGLNHGRWCESRDAPASSNFFDHEPTLCYVSV